jgi:ribosomal protein L33
VREDGRLVGGEGGRKKYVTERNGRSSWERQVIVTFCTCQRNEWMKCLRNMKTVVTINGKNQEKPYPQE